MKKFCSYFGISYFLLFGTIILLLATAQDVYAQTKKKKSGVVAPIPPKEPEPTYQLHLTNSKIIAAQEISGLTKVYPTNFRGSASHPAF